MKLNDFDYNLPKELIAQEPMKPRDHSRLLLLDKESGEIEHRHFNDLADYLRAGDVIVMNNSKVFPARLIGQREGSGGKVEVFLLRNLSPHSPLLASRRGGIDKGEVWQCLVGGHRRKEGLAVEFENGLEAEVTKNNQDGTFDVRFNESGKVLMDIVNKIGQMPLPPYIKRRGIARNARTDEANYQTVYADDSKVGSVAAPTAGFHFTPELIDKLQKKGVQFEYITLHVGLGTFAPVKTDDITKHKMHAEWVEVEGKLLASIAKAKKEGRRIIAVGTTSVRTLESIYKKILSINSETINKIENRKSKIENYQGWVNIFIYPGYEFRIVDAMITNFHLPKSTLLMLVSAFAGKENIDKAYQSAIKNGYRFFSYGDAMLVY